MISANWVYTGIQVPKGEEPGGKEQKAHETLKRIHSAQTQHSQICKWGNVWKSSTGHKCYTNVSY